MVEALSESAAQGQDEPRGWVVRLGHYLRIFGGRGDAGQPEHRAYIDRLAEMAKEKEAEHGR